MLDQLQPLQGTSYELPSLREKVTPDNIYLILYNSPIMACGIPLPSDISYSGSGTSSHKVKVLLCLTLFLINVYDFLTYATTTFPQTIRNCGGDGLMSFEFYWCEWSKSYLCQQSTLLCDFYHHGIYFLTSSVLLYWSLRQVEHPMLWPEAALRNLSSCRLTPVRWHPAEAERRPARLLLNGEKRELSCRNRVITVHGVTFSN